MEFYAILHLLGKTFNMAYRYAKQTNMKRLYSLVLMLIPALLWGQTKQETSAIMDKWKEIDRLISIKNYEQTKPLLADIKAYALKHKDDPMFVKAFLAESNVHRINNDEEKFFEQGQAYFEKNIAASKSVLVKSVLTNFYAQYLQSMLYLNYSEPKNAFLKMSRKERMLFIDSLYASSLKNKQELAQENLPKWAAIFADTENISLSPTMYHYLGYFYISFLNLSNSPNPKQRAQLVEDLLQRSRTSKSADAISYLLSAQLDRSKFTTLKKQADAYYKIIESNKSDYNAYLYFELASAYKSEQRHTEALQIIKKAKEEYPKSKWINSVKNLENEILRPEIWISHKKYEPSEWYTPFKLNYKNLDTLYIRVYQAYYSPKDLTDYKVNRDSLSNLVTVNSTVVYEDQLDLKASNDFKGHSTIYKINPLPFGKYILLYSNNAEFKDDGVLSKVVSTSIQISDLDISNVEMLGTYEIRKMQALLLDKKTGLPYANKELAFYDIVDKQAKLYKQFKTDKNGLIDYSTKASVNTMRLKDYVFYIPEERQFIDIHSLQYGSDGFEESEDDQDEDSQTRATILTDRAIYRPGQEVQFKAIVYNDNPRKGRTQEDMKVEISLLDANSQVVDSLRLATNAFGSVHGKLNIPTSTLNGQFMIRIGTKGEDFGQQYVRVEEYKRPTFKVTLDTNKETYSKKDTAVFKGNAAMLSGAPLIDAEVKYKVQVSSYQRRYRQFEIADTSTFTDEHGNFEFKIPLMDTALAELTNFTLSYTVEVVNQTGEMQSISAAYTYADKPWNLAIEVASPAIEGKWKEIKINSTNPNNQFLPMKGTVKIYKTTGPDKVISDKFIQYFNEVERLVLSYADYERYFPHYFEKSVLNKEVRQELVATYEFNTADTNLVRIDSQLFKKGIYRIVASSKPDADSIKAERTIFVVDEETKSHSDKTFFTVYTDKPVYNTGDKVTIHVESKKQDAKNVVLLSLSGDKMRSPIHLALKDGKASYSFTLDENALVVPLRWRALFIVDNQLSYQEVPVEVKRTEKTIVIKTASFRDKITPGMKEKWSFTLSSSNKKLETEILASMYDASLDQFASLYYPSTFRMAYAYYNNDYDHIQQGFDMLNYQTDEFPDQFAYPYYFNSLPTIQNYNFWQGEFLPFPSPAVYLSEGAIMGTTKGVEGRSYKSMSRSLNTENVVEEVVVSFDSNYAPVAPLGEFGPKKVEDLDQVKARTNLQETAFFYPTLYSDAEGNVSFEFDSPEALTQWKLLLFAHGKNLEAGTASFYTQTQKELMVRPNLPRYFREGDEMTIKAQVQNLSEKQQDGQAKIQLINPVDNSDVTKEFLQEDAMKSFVLAKKNNQIVEWRVKVPASYPTIQVKIVAASAEFSDGEIQELAVLPNKVLILESEKVLLKANEAKEFKLESAAKENLMAKVQVQSNPILEIISALDYLNHYPYECTEQSSSRWFGLKMVQYIGNHYPAIVDYFKEIKAKETKSRLEENASLNELKMQEMPWLRDIQGDEKKLQALAELFNSNIDAELKQLESKLAKAQLANGAFPWFEGGNSNTQISIRILEVFGKVLYLDKSLINAPVQDQMKRLTIYLDADSNIYKEKASAELALDYLYARHFWNGYFKLSKETSDKLNKKIASAPIITATGPAGLAAKAWIVNQLYGSGKEANELKNRIQQEAIFDKGKGTYWPSNEHYNSVSLHTYLVEAFKSYDPSKLMDITQWLYYKKEANSWRSTWMTVDAIYALLYANNPKDFAMENTVNVLVDGKTAEMNNAVLGQVSKTFSVSELTSNKTIQIANNNDRTIYGGVYHQYFIPVEQVKANTNELRVSKQYLVERNGKWVETKEAKLGERIKVKITVVNDKPLQYVHLKDSRPAGVEPVYRPSGYQWRGSFYFTLKDASTNYFFDYLPKGTREYEYEVKANNIGLFNSGLSSIECMYDPTVNARSANVKLTIVE